MVRKSMLSILLAAIFIIGAPSKASVITLLYQCESCAISPLPTNIHFDETTQLFEQFTVRWNHIDFDFTFPNLQPAFVRQWFWDALNGRPVTPTALPDSEPAQVFPIRWFADAYTPDVNACFVFFIGASGAGPRCVTPPLAQQAVFPAHESGTARSVPVSEPDVIALLGIAFVALQIFRSCARIVGEINSIAV
jgi:hypothetical protein